LLTSLKELFERIISEDFELTERDCIVFMRQICDGVSFMHNKQVLHLDLKPENILCVDKNPTSHRIKIIDFGLARRYDRSESVKVMFGTPEFVAPEVINYEEINFGTDMWSIGVIAYILLSGFSPFMGDNDAETLANVTSAEWDFEVEEFDEISDTAKNFIEYLLVRKKEDRMTAGECLQHPWLAPKNFQKQSVKKLSTVKHKKFVARRKWQKAGHALLALGRIGKLASRDLFSNASSSPSNSSSPSLAAAPDASSTAATSGSPSLSSSSSAPQRPKQEVDPLKGDIPSSRGDKSKSGAKSEMAAPEFVKEMIDVEVLEGDKARFDVKVKGSPEPDVIWHKEDNVLEEDGKRLVFEDDDNGIHSLIINGVVPSDGGYYKAIVRNSAGEIESEAELYVEPTGGRPLGGTELYNT